MWINRYNMYWRQLSYEIESHSDEYFMSNLQQKNIASNMKFYAEKILECIEHLDFDNDKPQIENTTNLNIYHLEQEIERLQKELEEKTSKGEWISVNDSLPKPFVSVLVYMPDEIPFPTVREGFINNRGEWYAGGFDRLPDEVVMWREMPTPPETKGETE